MPSVEDLKPKPFKIKVDGVELECQPLRLSHALSVAKIGEVFQNAKSATKEESKQAEKDMDEIIEELIPELKGVHLDVGKILQVISQMMGNIQPTDNKYLEEKGVKFDSDPKAGKIG